MELEINEPVLYIGSSSDAAHRFADAIVTRRSSRRSGSGQLQHELRSRHDRKSNEYVVRV
jgi:ABC-type molybdate transport system ATPase subunit